MFEMSSKFLVMCRFDCRAALGAGGGASCKASTVNISVRG